jgi:aspartate/methionine/tyrosine aminotransferase
MKTPIDSAVIARAIDESKVHNIQRASIREVVRLVNTIEKLSGTKFVRMEMGVPGINAEKVGVEAEIESLRKGVAAIYPDIEGIKELKDEASRFIKLFLDTNVSPSGIVPTVGSMQGGFCAFLMSVRRDVNKTTTLFIDPGFPVQKQQHKVLGIPVEQFDVYNYRGEKLAEKLESYLKTGKIASIVYSNPNNPSWICFTDDELKTIGTLAKKYDVIVIEDLAYFGMDFRQDYSVPGQAPFQPTVAKYTDNYMLMISSSKIFSYAGQRIGILAISDTLYHRTFPDLKRYFTSDSFGFAAIYGALYALSSGTCHSAQFALAAMFKAVNDGVTNLTASVKEYEKRASLMKELFVKYGFNIVYDTDLGRPLANGFYFTISYPGYSGGELVEELLPYGISAITLDITGSERKEGLRACVSQVRMEQIPVLEERLKIFYENHK